jgi:hypothetical protein
MHRVLECVQNFSEAEDLEVLLLIVCLVVDTRAMLEQVYTSNGTATIPDPVRPVQQRVETRQRASGPDSDSGERDARSGNAKLGCRFPCRRPGAKSGWLREPCGRLAQHTRNIPEVRQCFCGYLSVY